MSFYGPSTTWPESANSISFRYAWYRTVIVPANWKITMEAFNEFYHVQTTHSQLLPVVDDYSISKPLGRHGWISYAAQSGFALGRSPRLPAKQEPARNLVLEYAEQMKFDTGALLTERSYQAAQRLRTEATDDTPIAEVMGKYFQWTVEAAVKEGAGWPEGTDARVLSGNRIRYAHFSEYDFSSYSGGGSLVSIPPASRWPRQVHFRHLVAGTLCPGQRAAAQARIL